MSLEQALSLAQTLRLSPTLLQSMEILQMTTLELGEYLKNLALENPVLEESGGGPELSWEEFSNQVPWADSGPGFKGNGTGAEPGEEMDDFSSLTFHLTEQQAKVRLGQLVAREDPKHPLSDQALMELLLEEGFQLARRTVAKYRQALGIAGSRQRRR